MKVVIDGSVQEAKAGELLIDLINPTGGSVPHVCYHPQLARFTRVTQDGESELPTGASLRNPNHGWNPAVGI